MDTKKVGALVIFPLLLLATIVPPCHKEPHTEQDPTTPEPALIMDGAIISTRSGTAPTLNVMLPNQFE